MSKRIFSPNLPEIGSQFGAWAKVLTRRLTEIFLYLADRAETLDSDTDIEDGVIVNAAVAERTLSRDRLAKDGAGLCRDIVQTIPTNTWMVVEFNGAHFDEGGYVNTAVSPYGLVVPADGCYQLDAHAAFFPNAVGRRQVSVLVNDAVTIAAEEEGATTGLQTFDLNVTTTLNQDDIVVLRVRQTSGGDLILDQSVPYSPRLSLVRVW